jgi:hypothetical protein
LIKHRGCTLAAALVIVTMSSGCAFGTRHVNLTYAPTLDAAKSGTARGRIAVARLREGRTSEEGTGTLLGKVRNGYGMPTASVQANQDPVIWVNEAIARTLTSYGFAVEKVETPASAGDLATVTGIVDRVSGGMYWNMDAHVKTDLAVEQHGTHLFDQRCEGEASQVAWTASAASYEEVFQRALEDYLAKCIPHLVPTLEGRAGQ